MATCARSEEHTSELQSRRDLVCRLLLEKKKRYWLLVTRYAIMAVKPKEQRVEVLIDVQNLYYSARNLYHQKVNFAKVFFFVISAPNTEIYTLSLHDALPI